MIPVDTPKGRFRVWTKRVGNSPRIKLLLLHGGPGITHEYLEPCDSWLLPGARDADTLCVAATNNAAQDRICEW